MDVEPHPHPKLISWSNLVPTSAAKALHPTPWSSNNQTPWAPPARRIPNRPSVALVGTERARRSCNVRWNLGNSSRPKLYSYTMLHLKYPKLFYFFSFLQWIQNDPNLVWSDRTPVKPRNVKIYDPFHGSPEPHKHVFKESCRSGRNFWFDLVCKVLIWNHGYLFWAWKGVVVDLFFDILGGVGEENGLGCGIRRWLWPFLTLFGWAPGGWTWQTGESVWAPTWIDLDSYYWRINGCKHSWTLYHTLQKMNTTWAGGIDAQTITDHHRLCTVASSLWRVAEFSSDAAIFPSAPVKGGKNLPQFALVPAWHLKCSNGSRIGCSENPNGWGIDFISE